MASEDPVHHLCILGSTGSIGRQTLEVIRLFPERFRVHVLAAGSNAELLIAQAKAFWPEVVVIRDEVRVPEVRRELAGTGIQVYGGEKALAEVATFPEVDMVVAAVVGFAGLLPVMEAVRAGKRVALANKETLVVGGALIRQEMERSGAELIPVDSEHSAIFQCLVGEQIDDVEQLILTASGGPFRTRPLETFSAITPEEALCHPNWSMGAKITIDSATMMNKGLEVIEAYWLFGMKPERIQVLIHPQSIIHSMVAFMDGSVKAQLGVPDMRVPIQYALTYPERWPAEHPRIDWQTLRKLEFEEPDPRRFPSLRLAYEALAQGGLAPAVLNAANEEAVFRFLQRQIGFMDIPRLVEEVLAETPQQTTFSLSDVQHVDAWARKRVRELSGIPAD